MRRWFQLEVNLQKPEGRRGVHGSAGPASVSWKVFLEASAAATAALKQRGAKWIFLLTEPSIYGSSVSPADNVLLENEGLAAKMMNESRLQEPRNLPGHMFLSGQVTRGHLEKAVIRYRSVQTACSITVGMTEIRHTIKQSSSRGAIIHLAVSGSPGDNAADGRAALKGPERYLCFPSTEEKSGFVRRESDLRTDPVPPAEGPPLVASGQSQFLCCRWVNQNQEVDLSQEEFPTENPAQEPECAVPGMTTRTSKSQRTSDEIWRSGSVLEHADPSLPAGEDVNPEHVFQMFLRSDRCQNLTGGETSSKSVLETEEEVIVHFYIGGFGRFQMGLDSSTWSCWRHLVVCRSEGEILGRAELSDRIPGSLEFLSGLAGSKGQQETRRRLGKFQESAGVPLQPGGGAAAASPAPFILNHEGGSTLTSADRGASSAIYRAWLRRRCVRQTIDRSPEKQTQRR
ncbi:hypothetical protein FQA47_011082 [Oryzias melastigma]|uniref:Uncharacterized protein n=1 Tax=Oryzias melastigma TaxID=30732 RepID=A0A834CCC6_ORYME|nr:hypothetical protein FQA47_011082 [Oryzias melastigma]